MIWNSYAVPHWILYFHQQIFYVLINLPKWKIEDRVRTRKRISFMSSFITLVLICVKSFLVPLAWFGISTVSVFTGQCFFSISQSHCLLLQSMSGRSSLIPQAYLNAGSADGLKYGQCDIHTNALWNLEKIEITIMPVSSLSFLHHTAGTQTELLQAHWNILPPDRGAEKSLKLSPVRPNTSISWW